MRKKDGPYQVPEPGISPTLYTEFGYRGAKEVANLTREVNKLKEKVKQLEHQIAKDPSSGPKTRRFSSRIPPCP